MKQIVKQLTIFIVIGLTYFGIEMAVRGRSDISMIICAGLIGVIVGLLNDIFSYDMLIQTQLFIGSVVATVCEGVTGLILNVWLGLNIWDYSDKPLNLYGVICLENSVYWYFLSGIAIVLDDTIRWKFFGEDKPHYRWI